jgi:hypothetical protein
MTIPRSTQPYFSFVVLLESDATDRPESPALFFDERVVVGKRQVKAREIGDARPRSPQKTLADVEKRPRRQASHDILYINLISSVTMNRDTRTSRACVRGYAGCDSHRA